MKKILLLGGVVAALVPASSAMAAQGGGACTLDGTAKLTPGLSSNTPTPAPSVPSPSWGLPHEVNWGTPFTYSFHGTLANCNGGSSSGPGGPTGGTISAGENITINGVQYETLGAATGNGGCSGSSTSGTSIIQWTGGALSVVDYKTEGAAAAVGLAGTFRSGTVQLTRVQRGPNGEILRDSFPLAFGGDYAGGPLVFHPTDPQDCTPAGAATGVTDAPITGAIFRGNYS